MEKKPDILVSLSEDKRSKLTPLSEAQIMEALAIGRKEADAFLLNCRRVWLRPPTIYLLALATKAIEVMNLRKDEDIDIWAEHIAADVADVND